MFCQSTMSHSVPELIKPWCDLVVWCITWKKPHIKMYLGFSNINSAWPLVYISLHLSPLSLPAWVTKYTQIVLYCCLTELDVEPEKREDSKAQWGGLVPPPPPPGPCHAWCTCLEHETCLSRAWTKAALKGWLVRARCLPNYHIAFSKAFQVLRTKEELVLDHVRKELITVGFVFVFWRTYYIFL